MKKTLKKFNLISNKTRCIRMIFIVIFILFFVALLNIEVNAGEKYGEIYETETDYITRILPQTTLQDFKNNIDNEDVIVTTNEEEVILDENYIGSEMKAQIGDNTYILSIIGDLDGNGKITITDLAKLRLYVSNISPLDGANIISADINNDGKISITDLVQLNLITVKLKDIIAPNILEVSTNATKETIAVLAKAKREVGETIEYSFKIDNEEWVENGANGSYTFTEVDTEQVHKIRVKVADNSGNINLAKTVKIEEQVGQIEIKPSTLDWTNKDIFVEVKYNSDIENTKKMISVDGGQNFEEYTGVILIEENTTIVAQIKNENDEVISEKTLEIANIDKEEPEEFTPTITPGRRKITVDAETQDTQSGIKEYKYTIIDGLWSWEETTQDTTYTFMSLVQDIEYKVKVEAIDYAGNRKEVTVENVYTDARFIVTIDVNGGEYEGDISIPGETGEIVELLEPTRVGYTFVGWDLDGEGTVNETRFVFGESDATIKAEWEIIKYEIVYNLDDGEETTNPIEYDIESDDIILNIPMKLSNEFIGWTGSNGTTPQMEVIIEKGSTGNKEYTANWRLHTIFVSLYDTDDDSVGDCLAFSNNSEDVLNYGTLIQRYEDNINKGHFETPSDAPWYSQRNNIKTVEIMNEILPTSMASWFFEFKNLTQIINLENINTENTYFMVGTFEWCEKLTSLDLRSFNTNRVVQMDGMFFACRGLESVDVSSFNTSNVRSMYGMFYRCEELVDLDLSNFDTSNVTDMAGMFCWCWNLKNLNINSFNTSKVTTMQMMFCWCCRIESLDLRNFDTSNVTDMSDMFSWCMYITDINVSNFDTSNVTNMYEMFYCCYEIENIDLTSFDMSNVTNMKSMFSTCHKLASVTVRTDKWITTQADTSNAFAYSPIDDVTYV